MASAQVQRITHVIAHRGHPQPAGSACHDLSVGTSQTATELIRRSAEEVTSGDGSVADLRSTLLINMDDLCRDRPLEGDYLSLFQAIERWESSVGPDHDTAQSEIKDVAARLAAR